MSPVVATPFVRMKSKPVTAVRMSAVLAPVVVVTMLGSAVLPMTKVGEGLLSAADTIAPSETAKPVNCADLETFHSEAFKFDHGVALIAATSFLFDDWEAVRNCRLVCVMVSIEPLCGVV